MSSDLAKLLRNSHITSDEDILKAANASLKASKTDVLAQHTRVVALLKLDRFEDAIRAFETGGDKLKETARLEYAYALYKTGSLKEAVKVAGQSEERGLAHVAAQSVRFDIEQSCLTWTDVHRITSSSSLKGRPSYTRSCHKTNQRRMICESTGLPLTRSWSGRVWVTW
jgi:hypothetical protein